MAHTYEICLALWHEVLKTPIGLAITPDDDDVQGLRQAMFKAREKARDVRLQGLETYISPDGKELWLCRRQESLS